MFVKRKILLSLLLFGLLICAGSSAQAEGSGPVILDDAQTRYPMDLYLEYLEDPGGKLTIDQVSGPEFSARFTPNQEDTPNFGVTQSAIWVRLRVRNDTSQVHDWRLAFTNARMGLIDFYYSSLDGMSWAHQQAGTFLPARVREFDHPHFVFPLSIQSSSEATIYLRLQSNLPMRFSLSLWPAELFEQYNHGFFGFIGIFYGIVGIMVIYNLLIFLFVRRVVYLYYSLFIVFYTLSTASSDGTAPLYLYPDISSKYFLYIYATLSVVFSALFIRTFLELRVRLPWLDRLLISLAGIQVLSLALYGRYPQIIALASLLILLFATLSILGAILVWRQGLHSTRYFLIGWSVLLLNAVLFNSTNINIIQRYPLFDYGNYISATLLVTFLSLALADQINAYRAQTLQSETALLASEERFRHLYERAPLGIALADPAGLIEQANPTYQKLTGYDEQELRHLDYLELIHPEDRPAARETFQRLVQGELDFVEGEARYRRKDGNLVWVSRSVSALSDEQGKIRHTFAILTDITQRKRDEEELRRYSENLEELVAARTRELERSREQLLILNRSSQVVNAAGLDIEQVYVAIRAASAWLVPAEIFAISIIDLPAGEFEDVYLADRDRRLPGGRYPLKDSFVEEMLASGSSLKVDDFQTCPEEDWRSHWFGCYQGVRSGMAVLLQVSQEDLGVISVQSFQPNAYQGSDLSILESFAAHAAVSMENIRLHQQAQKVAVLEERQRLARELHDSVTQLLYSTALLSNGWGLKAKDQRLENPADCFNQIEALSLQALKEMRLLIHQLRPPVLDEVGLIKALQNRLESVEQRVKVDARLFIEGDLPALSHKVEEDLYFIIQEALNNALRHAHAAATRIDFKAAGRQLYISVEDNGRGYDPERASNGMGTNSMRERASAIGAQFQIDSSPGQGTKVSVSLGV